MRRRALTPRQGWQQIVASQGLTFHSVDGRPYWDESACWEFSAAEIDRLEAAAAEIQRLCLEAGDHMLRNDVQKDLFRSMHIPPEAEAAIRQTWRDEPPALYGRLDLAYDGTDIKLLEYNADTPTSLVEASVIQWRWLESCFPQRDQWNGIHERLVAKWRDLKPYLASPVYFTHDGAEEDALTVAYLEDTAREAGLRSAGIRLARLGWSRARACFVDEQERPVGSLFKLYPWETLLREPFGTYALQTMARGQHHESGRTQWVEPIWKMLWSNKALLAVLWALYPDHPLLLPAFLDGPRGMRAYVRKPLLGREGANVSWTDGTRRVETGGAFKDGPWLYQALAPLAQADGHWAVLGVWMVDGEPCGLGMREGRGPVIRNTDSFVPHLF